MVMIEYRRRSTRGHFHCRACDAEVPWPQKICFYCMICPWMRTDFSRLMLRQRPQLEQSLHHVFAFFLPEMYTLHGRRKAFLKVALLHHVAFLQIYVYLGPPSVFQEVPDEELVDLILTFLWCLRMRLCGERCRDELEMSWHAMSRHELLESAAICKWFEIAWSDNDTFHDARINLVMCARISSWSHLHIADLFFCNITSTLASCRQTPHSPVYPWMVVIWKGPTWPRCLACTLGQGG